MDDCKPSSSDDIIASLINEVRKTSEPFDVKCLIGGSLEMTTKKGTESGSGGGGENRSLTSHKHGKKSKHRKDKKSRKSKKSKHKSRSKSKSPPRKKKKHRNRSRSSSESRKNCRENDEKLVNCAIPPSVEAVMEKISDDEEDDLPVGADFLSINAGSSKIDKKSEQLLQNITTAVQNKTKEFNVNEEVFPLSKKRKKSESPPAPRKPRPLSEILAKVRAERDSALVPRNIKLKREIGKSAATAARTTSHSITKSNGDGAAEYGPRPFRIPEPLPISDDDDELQFAPVRTKPSEASKSVRIGSISKMLSDENNKKSQQFGEDGEIPVSDVSPASSSASSLLDGHNVDVDDSDGELIDDARLRSECGVSDDDYEKEIRRKVKERTRKKEKRAKKHGNRIRMQASLSSSSADSENEWKRLEKKNKAQIPKRLSRREFDKGRWRIGGPYVESYYVDSNKQVHEGTKWRYKRGEKDAKKEKNNVISTKRPKGWRARVVGGSPIAERKRKRPSSSSRSHSRSYSRSRTRSRSRSSSRSSRSSHHHKSRNSQHKRHHHHRHHHDRKSKSKSKSKSGRRSSATSVDLKIDKKKLLEIAQRNAAQMAQLGYLPNAAPETRAQLKAGGQSVDQLVDFCQKLQRSQDKAVRREKGEQVSSDEEDLAPRRKKVGDDDTDFVKHPFALKPAVPITINIPNSVPIPTKTPAQRTLEESQLRIAYPVSSGAQHREKDNEWTPVIKEEVPSVCNPAQKTKLAVPLAHKKKEKILSPFGKIGSIDSSSFLLPPPPTPPILASFTQSASSLLNLPPPPPPPDLVAGGGGCSGILPMDQPKEEESSSLRFNYADVMTVSEEDKSVFKESESLNHTPANVGKVMAKRVKASKLLAKDPNDYEARRMLNEADDQIKAWAESKKNLPGKFTGTTGVNVLKADQLGPEDPRFNAWAKKDFFKQASAVNSGVGLKLMQKMGWTPGEGLGKGRDGPLEPLVLDIKSDRKGLVATEELPGSKKVRSNFGKDMAGKHPVSVLMELCSKKHWSAPQFTCAESGPSNNRRFLWKAVVNGVEYQPAVPSTSKKTGKAQACQVVLQSLGLVPRDPSLPVVL